MNKVQSGYAVGALLYCPAINHQSIVNALIAQRLPAPFSLAFCLEDTVRQESVASAEETLLQTLTQILQATETHDFYLPHIFIRVRSPLHLRSVAVRFAPVSNILTGFILPKFFLENCDCYLQELQVINSAASTPYAFMPIFESPSMMDLRSRYENLYTVRDKLSAVSDCILNIRVGGNDLCHSFGLRRRPTNTIYDIHPVANLLTDIVTVFGSQYVISGPVWEYYNGPGWDTGLRRELELDLLNGFVGKTVIHPNQIPIIQEGLKVPQMDYDDARAILNWDAEQSCLVSANSQSSRMNEYNTHSNWAKRILTLAALYGIQEE